MTSSGTFGVHFVMRNSKKSNGKSPVCARITVNGTRSVLALKKYLSLAGIPAKEKPGQKRVL
jgi:hypothetical protein